MVWANWANDGDQQRAYWNQLVEQAQAARPGARSDPPSAYPKAERHTSLNRRVTDGMRRHPHLALAEDFAPRKLIDRDAELAALTDFCSGTEPYLVIEAPAWSGKTALLSWFVLHPPVGVDIISFFIVARWASQSDSVAFTEALLEQVAGLLNESVPDSTSPISRDGHRRVLLRAAVEQAHTSGRQIVMVLDGLDEDRGQALGSDMASIASLLPVTGIEGLKVVTTKRPHPLLPADLEPEHALRHAIRWSLRPSPQAVAIRDRARLELHHVLGRHPSARDIVGLLLAARGALTKRDIGELLDCLPFEIDHLLSGTAGRLVIRVVDQPPSTQSAGYLLGHDALQAEAADALGAREVERYRSLIHRWADGYRAQRWPEDTPAYLTTAYAWMLFSVAADELLFALVLDVERHDWMRLVVGSDVAALNEVGLAQRRIRSKSEPDLSQLAQLSRRRAQLVTRTGQIPTKLPALWTAVGQHERARRLIEAITEADRRVESLILAAEAALVAGDNTAGAEFANAALNEIKDVTFAPTRAKNFPRLIALLGATGLAEPMAETRRLADAALTDLGSFDDRRWCWEYNLKDAYKWATNKLTILALPDEPEPDKAGASGILAGQVRLLVESGEYSRALRYADALHEPDDANAVFPLLIETIASRGLVDESVRLIERIADPCLRAASAARISLDLGAGDNLSDSTRFASIAQALLIELPDGEHRIEVTANIATAMARTGQIHEATLLAEAVAEQVQSLDPENSRPLLLTAAVASLVAVDRCNLAERCIKRFSGGWIIGPLVDAGEGYLKRGSIDAARRLAMIAHQTLLAYDAETDSKVKFDVVRLAAAAGLDDVVDSWLAIGDLWTGLVGAAIDGNLRRRHYGQVEQLCSLLHAARGTDVEQLCSVVKRLVAFGELARAERIALAVFPAVPEVLAAVVTASATSGHCDRALTLLSAMRGTRPYEDTAAAVAIEIGTFLDFNGASTVIAELQPEVACTVWSKVAHALVASWQFDAVDQLVKFLDEPTVSVKMLCAAAETLIAMEDRSNAARFAEKADAAARVVVNNPEALIVETAVLSGALLLAGKVDHARRLAREAAGALRSPQYRPYRKSTLSVAVALALCGLAHEALEVTEQDAYGGWCIDVVEELIDWGRTEEAKRFAEAAIGRWLHHRNDHSDNGIRVFSEPESAKHLACLGLSSQVEHLVSIVRGNFPQRAETMLIIARTKYANGDHVGFERIVAEVWSTVIEVDSVVERCAVLQTLGAMMADIGDFVRANKIVDVLRDLDSNDLDPLSSGCVSVATAKCLIAVGRLHESHRYARLAEAQVSRIDDSARRDRWRLVKMLSCLAADASDADRAIDLALSLRDTFEEMSVEVALITSLVENELYADALVYVDALGGNGVGAQPLLAQKLTSAKQWRMVEDVVRMIDNPSWQAEAWSTLAREHHAAGNVHDARRCAAAALGCGVYPIGISAYALVDPEGLARFVNNL